MLRRGIIGCGSSREHAPIATMGVGLRVDRKVLWPAIFLECHYYMRFLFECPSWLNRNQEALMEIAK